MAWSIGWPAAAVPADYVLSGVRAVLPGAIVDDVGSWPVVRATFRAA